MRGRAEGCSAPFPRAAPAGALLLLLRRGALLLLLLLLLRRGIELLGGQIWRGALLLLPSAPAWGFASAAPAWGFAPPAPAQDRAEGCGVGQLRRRTELWASTSVRSSATRSSGAIRQLLLLRPGIELQGCGVGQLRCRTELWASTSVRSGAARSSGTIGGHRARWGFLAAASAAVHPPVRSGRLSWLVSAKVWVMFLF